MKFSIWNWGTLYRYFWDDLKHLKRNQSRSLAIRSRGGIRNEGVGVQLARVVQEQEHKMHCRLLAYCHLHRASGTSLWPKGTVVVIHDHVMIKLSSSKGLACTQLDPAIYLGSPWSLQTAEVSLAVWWEIAALLTPPPQPVTPFTKQQEWAGEEGTLFKVTPSTIRGNYGIWVFGWGLEACTKDQK